MFDGLGHEIALRAKARTGATGELALWFSVIVLSTVIGVVFFSIAGYVWLAEILNRTIAAAIVGGVHILLVAAAFARCVQIRRRTTARAIAEIRASEQQTPWWSDPGVLAIGYQIAKIIGLKKLPPLIAVGVLAATLTRKNSERRAPRGNNHESAGNNHAR